MQRALRDQASGAPARTKNREEEKKRRRENAATVANVPVLSASQADDLCRLLPVARGVTPRHSKSATR